MGAIWDAKGLIFLGNWCIQSNKIGYGMLIIHATIFGVKVGDILHLKWKDFFNPETQKLDRETITINGEIISIQYVLKELNQNVFEFAKKNNPNLTYEDDVYINEKTDKRLSTSTLKRELQAIYKKTKEEILSLTGFELTYRDIETNAFEIAWARDMVNHYLCLKKIFILVSKRLGHRTLKHTVEALEIKINDDIELRFDFYPSTYFRKAFNVEKFYDTEKLKTHVQYHLESIKRFQ